MLTIGMDILQATLCELLNGRCKRKTVKDIDEYGCEVTFLNQFFQ